MNARELLSEYDEGVWTDKARDRDHKITELTKFISETKSLPVTASTDSRIFDKIIKSFLAIIVRFMAYISKKDNTLKRSLLSSVTTDNTTLTGAGEDLWIKDPFGEDEEYDSDFTALVQADKDVCMWYQGKTRRILIQKFRLLLSQQLISAVENYITDILAAEDDVLWSNVTDTVRDLLPDGTPKRLLESYLSMRRDSLMGLSEWVFSSYRTRQLVKDRADSTISDHLAFQYMAGQITL